MLNTDPSNIPNPVVIATRESRLALWQAEHIRDRLAGELGLAAELLGMTTRGDQILDRSLSKVGGKGLFVKELEVALEAGQAHLAVHSLKDVPMDLPTGYVLVAVPEREDPRDAFVSNHHVDLAALGRHQLLSAGVTRVDDVGGCTFEDAARFFSYRRDAGRTGRHLAVVVSRAG